MKDLNGFQLYQQIKAIDPTIKILFITALDILDEILTIVPGLSKDQILIKPVEEKVLVLLLSCAFLIGLPNSHKFFNFLKYCLISGNFLTISVY
jgi:DNA-binding NarL/FixJ family response regulator